MLLDNKWNSHVFFPPADCFPVPSPPALPFALSRYRLRPRSLGGYPHSSRRVMQSASLMGNRGSRRCHWFPYRPYLPIDTTQPQAFVSPSLVGSRLSLLLHVSPYQNPGSRLAFIHQVPESEHVLQSSLALHCVLLVSRCCTYGDVPLGVIDQDGLVLAIGAEGSEQFEAYCWMKSHWFVQCIVFLAIQSRLSIWLLADYSGEGETGRQIGE